MTARRLNKKDACGLSGKEREGANPPWVPHLSSGEPLMRMVVVRARARMLLVPLVTRHRGPATRGRYQRL